jgi:hypothetical protein
MTKFAHLPNHHRNPTVKTIFPGEIFYPPQDILTYNPGTSEVYLYGMSEIELTDRRPKKLLGRVGIMRSLILIDEKVIDVYIADLRHLESGVEVDDCPVEFPDDSEDQNYWFDAQKDRITLNGILYDESGVLEYDGNPELLSMALGLAKYTDEYSSELEKPVKKADKKPTADSQKHTKIQAPDTK